MPRTECPRTRDGKHVWYQRLFPSRVPKKDWCLACGHDPKRTPQEKK